MIPDTGWISFYIRESADAERAILLLRRSYELWREKQNEPTLKENEK